MKFVIVFSPHIQIHLYKIAQLQSLLHVSSYKGYKAVITLSNTVMVLSSNSHTKLSMNENEIENAIFPLFLPRTIRCGGDRAQPTAAIHNVIYYIMLGISYMLQL